MILMHVSLKHFLPSMMFNQETHKVWSPFVGVEKQQISETEGKVEHESCTLSQVMILMHASRKHFVLSMMFNQETHKVWSPFVGVEKQAISETEGKVEHHGRRADLWFLYAIDS